MQHEFMKNRNFDLELIMDAALTQSWSPLTLSSLLGSISPISSTLLALMVKYMKSYL
jgi:hypothetical protein